MRIISASNELRQATDQLQFLCNDLIPDPSNSETWRVPRETLAQNPAFWNLMLLYNQTESQEAKKRGRRIKIQRGPTWYLMGRGYLTGANELFVGIIGKAPCQMPSITPHTTTLFVENSEGEVADGEHPQTRDNPGAYELDAGEVQGNLEPAVDTHTRSECRSQELPRTIETVIMAALKDKLEIVIKKDGNILHSLDLSALGVGDRIELSQWEELEIRSGLLPMLAMAYEEEDIEEMVDDRQKH